MSTAARALVVLCLVGVLAGGAAWVLHERAGRPTVPKVVRAALAPSTADAPAVRSPGVLDRAVDGLHFPDWSGQGWRAEGLHTDRVGGRLAETIRYRKGDDRLTYTIVAGTDHVNSGTTAIARYRDGGQIEFNFVDGQAVLTGADNAAQSLLSAAFKRRLRTIVVTSSRVSPEGSRELMRLSTWNAGGRLEF